MAERMVALRTKDSDGKTIKQMIEAPLCEPCRGLGMTTDGTGVYTHCKHCNGLGELRAKGAAYPQINDEFQAAI